MRENYKKLLSCIILLIIFILCTLIIKQYFKPFITIVLLVYFGSPIFKILYNNKIFNKKMSALITIIFLNTIIVIIFFSIGNFVLNRMASIVTFNNYIQFHYASLYKKVTSMFNINSNFNNIFTKSAAYTAESFFAYFVGNIAAYFILVDKYVILDWIKNFIPQKKILIIGEKLQSLNNIMKIELILVTITTIETIIGLSILNIKHSIILGLICGILDIVPYVGTILVFLPLIIIKITEKNYIIAFGLALLYILLIVSRQILEAKFMSKKLKIHPLIILLSLYIGMKLFGIIGLFMGPLYIIITKEVILDDIGKESFV